MSSNTGISAVTSVSNCNPTAGVQYATGEPAIGVGATDFNNNGSVDRVTANSDNNSVTAVLMP